MRKEKHVSAAQTKLFAGDTHRPAITIPFLEPVRHFFAEFSFLTSHLYIVRAVLLFTVYIVTARIGLALFPVHTFATFLWMPTGIGLAALFLWGMELWPAIALGALVVALSLGAPFLIALGMTVGNTLEALVGVDFLRRHTPIDPSFGRLQDALYFFIVALFVTTISASIGTGSLLFGGLITHAVFPKIWVTWWIGDLLGAFLLTPLILVWCSPAYVKLSWRKTIESIVLFATLVGFSFLIFWTNLQEIELFPIIYLLFIPLMWAALRSSPRGITTALTLLSGITLTAAFLHKGAFVTVSTYDGLLSLQLFLGFLIIIFISFTSIAEEQKTLSRTLAHTVEQLDDAVQRLNAEDKLKNEFIATLAHEVRNPLAPILSSLEIAKLRAVDLQQQTILEPLDTIGSHLRTIVKLLEDLLDISRISEKKLKLNIESVQIQDLIEHSVETVQDFYTSRRHTLIISMPEKPIWMRVDPIRFEQIINNLLYNAAKYTNPGGRIELSAQVSNKELRIALRDNGLGIEPQLLKKIFEPFRQGTIATPIGTGLGIGLSLSKQLVEMHHGKIWAESKGAGHGSTFWIALPLSSSVQLPMITSRIFHKPREAERRRKSRGKKYSILIVDDNTAAAVSLQKLLAHNEHATMVAHDAASALQTLKTFRADIVLLDIGLPDMDGYQLAKQIQKDPQYHAPTLIALTGYGQQQDKLKARQAGFSHHLTKPVSITELEAVFNKLMGA